MHYPPHKYGSIKITPGVAQLVAPLDGATIPCLAVCVQPQRLQSVHAPPASRVCERRGLSASCAPRTFCFLLATRCRISTLERSLPFPRRLLSAYSADGSAPQTP